MPHPQRALHGEPEGRCGDDPHRRFRARDARIGKAEKDALLPREGRVSVTPAITALASGQGGWRGTPCSKKGARPGLTGPRTLFSWRRTRMSPYRPIPTPAPFGHSAVARPDMESRSVPKAPFVSRMPRFRCDSYRRASGESLSCPTDKPKCQPRLKSMVEQKRGALDALCPEESGSKDTGAPLGVGRSSKDAASTGALFSPGLHLPSLGAQLMYVGAAAVRTTPKTPQKTRPVGSIWTADSARSAPSRARSEQHGESCLSHSRVLGLL